MKITKELLARKGWCKGGVQKWLNTPGLHEIPDDLTAITLDDYEYFNDFEWFIKNIYQRDIKIHMDGKTWQYEYDDNGNLIRTIHYSGKIFDYPIQPYDMSKIKFDMNKIKFIK